VIQISSQIQSIENPEARQSVSLGNFGNGVSDSDSPGVEKTGGKEGLGVFAKLLAGLLRKPSGAEAGTGVEAPGKTPSAGKDLSVDKASEAGASEDAEVPAGRAGRKKGKSRGLSLLLGPSEGAGRAEALLKKEKAGAKSAGEDSGAELLVSGAGSAADKAGVKPAAVEAAEAAWEGVQAPAEGSLTGNVENAAGGASEAAASASGGAALYKLAEAQARDSSGGASRDREVPAGESSRKAGEGLAGGRPAVGSARSPLRENAGRDGRNPAEIKVKDRRRERSNTEAGETRAGLDRQSVAEGAHYQAEAAKADERPGGRETELTVELRSMGKTQSEISVDRENRPVQSFQNMLARELHENLNGDIVRHASVMLRDGGEGTIRLSLRPETLGSVKIRLEITENKITGRITVESGDAFKAFERELHSLEQSFRDSGFDGASLEMAFSSGGEEGGRQEEADSRFPGRLAALRYDAAISGAAENGLEEIHLSGMRPDSQGMPLVNMLV
jgi:flagellar hook-length control protein FliK